MCGRFSQGEPSHRIADYFGGVADDDLPGGLWNVPPTEQIRVVLHRGDERRLAAATWGFEPSWADAGGRRSWINARSETAWDSRAFGPALRATRCIVPVDAFFEWDRSASPRQPYAIGPGRENELLALAGIWSPRPDALPTVAILTTAARGPVAGIHDRMPVILERGLVADWLDPATPPGALAPMLLGAPAADLRMWPVSTAVNRVQSDGPQLLRPVELAPSLGLI